MSYTFILTGKSSSLSSDINPTIYLEDDAEYEIGLLNFDSYYSIPNVDAKRNTFLWWTTDGSQHTAVIADGAYEIATLFEEIRKTILRVDTKAVITFDLNHNTSKVILETNRKISFDVKNSIGSVLGFRNKIVEPNTETLADSPVQILKVNAICIDCNIAAGSFLNGNPVHIIHSFFPTVSPGYKIVEAPETTIYYPVTVKALSNITVQILDQDGELINFRDEIRTVRLHLRRV